MTRNESAFGVDHGEFSKAFGTSAVAGLRSLGQSLGAATKSVGVKSMPKLGPSAKPQGALRRMGGTAQTRFGQGMQRLGGGMQKSPGLTGGLAAGGAGAGLFGAGAHSSNNKKLAQYR